MLRVFLLVYKVKVGQIGLLLLLKVKCVPFTFFLGKITAYQRTINQLMINQSVNQSICVLSQDISDSDSPTSMSLFEAPKKREMLKIKWIYFIN